MLMISIMLIIIKEIRLSIAFKTSAESWINQQAKYDLWLAEKTRSQLTVKCLVSHAA